VTAEHGGHPLCEDVDVVVNSLGSVEGEQGEGFVGDFSIKKIGEFLLVSPAEVASLVRRAMFERDGKDTQYKRVV
jgi:hypothetical protein